MSAATVVLVVPAWAGPLDPPPGPITGSMKTINEAEPRIPINSTNTPGTASCLFRITQPGSYYLTSSHTGVPGKNGIEIEVPMGGGVTVDFRGHELVGVAGSLHGVTVSGEAIKFWILALRDGSVRQWGQDGINLPGKLAVVVEGMSVGSNLDDGIEVGSGARIHGCTVSTNMGRGINSTAGLGVIIEDTGIADNGGLGIALGSMSTVRNCALYDNLAGGVQSFGTHNEVLGCRMLRNSAVTFAANKGDVLRDNTFGVWGDPHTAVVTLASECTLSDNTFVADGADVGVAVLQCNGDRNTISDCKFMGSNTTASSTWSVVRLGGGSNTFRQNDVCMDAPAKLVLAGTANVVLDNVLLQVRAGGTGIRAEAAAANSVVEGNTIGGAGTGAYTAIQLLSNANSCVRNRVSRLLGGQAIDNQGIQSVIGPLQNAANSGSATNPLGNIVH